MIINSAKNEIMMTSIFSVFFFFFFFFCFLQVKNNVAPLKDDRSFRQNARLN